MTTKKKPQGEKQFAIVERNKLATGREGRLTCKVGNCVY